MKKFISAFLIPLGFIGKLCASGFEVDTVIIKSADKIISATYFDGNIYGLDVNGDIHILTGGDEYAKLPVPHQYFTEIYNIEGKLVALEHIFKPYKYNTYRQYRYNGKKFRKKGRIAECCDGLYEDENYRISSTCHGEWGGVVFFKDKRTRKKYGCFAACPVTVNEIDGSYFVTNTLGHGLGSAQVLQIDDPNELSPSAKKRKRIGRDESYSIDGAKALIDTAGVMAITSFPIKVN